MPGKLYRHNLFQDIEYNEEYINSGFGISKYIEEVERAPSTAILA